VGRGKERIWGEEIATPQPTVINWSGLNDKEKSDLIPTLSATGNWILLTHPLGASNKTQPPLREAQLVARADGKCSRHKGWWREGKDEFATHSDNRSVDQHQRKDTRDNSNGYTGSPGSRHYERYSLCWIGRPRR